MEQIYENVASGVHVYNVSNLVQHDIDSLCQVSI